MAGSADSREQGLEPGRNRPTMVHVARLAGVSQSSVSLVMNNMTGARISAETRQKVLEAAARIGYALPAVRRDDAAVGGPKSIAYLVDEISTSPHAVISLDGARDLAFSQGFLVAAHVTRSNPELEEATIAAIRRDRSVVGVIYSTIFTRQVRVPEALSAMPTVLLNCYENPPRFPEILPAEVEGGFAATAALAALGHQRIGFINGEPWMDAATDRLEGYCRALEGAGIAVDPDLVREGDWLPLSGYHRTLELMALASPPTAIFCGNDLMATGALKAAGELGLKVPDDLSIMGYDDQEVAQYTEPPLTSVMLPNYEMGRRAAESLIQWSAKGRPAAPLRTRIEGPRVQRGSIAAPRLELPKPSASRLRPRLRNSSPEQYDEHQRAEPDRLARPV